MLQYIIGCGLPLVFMIVNYGGGKMNQIDQIYRAVFLASIANTGCVLSNDDCELLLVEFHKLIKKLRKIRAGSFYCSDAIKEILDGLPKELKVTK
jgi:hypothetical protein